MYYIYFHSQILWEFPRTETRGSLLKPEPHTEQRRTTCLSSIDLFSTTGWMVVHRKWTGEMTVHKVIKIVLFSFARPVWERRLRKPGYYTKTKPFHTKRFCLPAAKMGFSYYVCSFTLSGSFSICLSLSFTCSSFSHWSARSHLHRFHRLTHFTKISSNEQ